MAATHRPFGIVGLQNVGGVRALIGSVKLGPRDSICASTVVVSLERLPTEKTALSFYGFITSILIG